jgi:hypothetical protein
MITIETVNDVLVILSSRVFGKRRRPVAAALHTGCCGHVEILTAKLRFLCKSNTLSIAAVRPKKMHHERKGSCKDQKERADV